MWPYFLVVITNILEKVNKILYRINEFLYAIYTIYIVRYYTVFSVQFLLESKVQINIYQESSIYVTLYSIVCNTRNNFIHTIIRIEYAQAYLVGDGIFIKCGYYKPYLNQNFNTEFDHENTFTAYNRKYSFFKYDSFWDFYINLNEHVIIIYYANF